MRTLITLAVVGLSVLAPAAGAESDDEGFVRLFNGKDFSGWMMGSGKSWVVDRGVIALERDMDGREHNLVVTFGDDGFWIYLDGQMADWEKDFTQGLLENNQSLAVGANTWARTDARPDDTWDQFDGRISDFQVFDSQYNWEGVLALAGIVPEEPLITGALGASILAAEYSAKTDPEELALRKEQRRLEAVTFFDKDAK